MTTDSCPNRALARLHVGHHTPVNSIVFGAITFAFSVIGRVGIGTQEAFQLLWNASAICYALTPQASTGRRNPSRICG